jgi:hypothetical protein
LEPHFGTCPDGDPVPERDVKRSTMGRYFVQQCLSG